jgi:hypothetical protein
MVEYNAKSEFQPKWTIFKFRPTALVHSNPLSMHGFEVDIEFAPEYHHSGFYVWDIPESNSPVHFPNKEKGAFLVVPLMDA